MSEQFDLPSELTIYSATQARDALLAWAEEQAGNASASLRVSARDVSAVDGAGLQLLAALRRSNLSWQLVEPSQPFAEACKTMGLSCWQEPAGAGHATTGETA